MNFTGKIATGFLGVLLLATFIIFVRPVGPEIYFRYKKEHFEVDGNKVEVYLVNSNPENGNESYFFRVKVDIKSSHKDACMLKDFDWELRGLSSQSNLFSTANKTGIRSKQDYFDNKIDGTIFKGMHGSKLEAEDFQVIITFDKNNDCGVTKSKLVKLVTMRLRRKKATIWDVMMSV